MPGFFSLLFPKESKVPLPEREFLADQRSQRKMRIRELDKWVSLSLKRKDSHNKGEKINDRILNISGLR